MAALTTALDGANGIAVTQIGDRHYALATAVHEHGVQIIDITDPSSPSAVAAVTDGDTYTELYGAAGITTVQTGDMHYALVASYYGWGGVQIINITDPSSPSAVDSLDGESFTRLFTGAYEITTVQTGDTYHALVVATRRRQRPRTRYGPDHRHIREHPARCRAIPYLL